MRRRGAGRPHQQRQHGKRRAQQDPRKSVFVRMEASSGLCDSQVLLYKSRHGPSRLGIGSGGGKPPPYGGAAIRFPHPEDTDSHAGVRAGSE